VNITKNTAHHCPDWLSSLQYSGPPAWYSRHDNWTVRRQLKLPVRHCHINRVDWCCRRSLISTTVVVAFFGCRSSPPDFYVGHSCPFSTNISNKHQKHENDVSQ